MVFTSKTIIPWKEPIGRNKDGSYIYDGVQSTMSVMPSKGTYDTEKQMSVMPKVWTPSTPVPMVKSPVWFNLMPKVDPTIASKVNAPIEDVKWILQVDKADPRIQKLEQHFKTLKQKGQLQLNQKQTEYVQRYKKNLPQYANVPDALLFWRIIMKYPEAQEKYGNIGQKWIIESIVGLPLAMAKTGSDAIMEAQDVFTERQKTLNKDGNLWITNLLASASAGRALWTGVMGMAGDVLNVASPFINPETWVTSVTEWLGRDIGTIVGKVPEEYRQQISDLMVKYPKISATLGIGFDLSNLIPFLGALGKAKSATQVDDILRQVKTSTSRTLVQWEILPWLKTAGKNIQKTITPNILSKDVATLRADRIEKWLRTQNNNLGKSVGKSYSNNTKTYTLDNGAKQTVTPIDTFKKYWIEPEVVDKTIKMWEFKNVREWGLWKIQDNIETIGDEITGTLKSTGKKISTKDYKKRVIAAAKQNDDLKRAGKVSETIKKIETKFDDYKESYGDEIDITEVDEIRKVSNRDWSPDTEDVSSLIWDVGRDIVYNSTDDMYVRDLLREQWNLLSARKYAISLNGTKVRWGRLWDLISGWAGAAVGAIAGAALPIPFVWPAIGAAAWQKVGTTLSKLFSSTQFKSPSAEFKWLFSKSGWVESPSIKVQRVPKVSTKSIESPKATIKSYSSTSPSVSSVESNKQKLLPTPQKPQVESWKSSILSQLSKEKSKSAWKKVNNSIIEKLAKKQETPKTPKTDYLNTTEAKMTDAELKSLAKKYLETSKLPVWKWRVNSDNMADYKWYARIRDYFKSQWDDSLLESKLPKTPQVEGKTEPRIISVKKNWKEVIDTPEFASRKDNILVSLANDSKSSTELTDVLNRVDKWMANESSIYWAISQNPNASAATKLRAADLYEKSQTSGYFDKPKSSLPLSQKSEVKYSKPDTLVQEAKKYKSAEEFVKAITWKDITVYRWTKEWSEFSGVGWQWHGAWKYYTDSKSEASLYWPSVKEYKVKLNKPFNMAWKEDIISVFGKTEWLSDQKIGNTTFWELSKKRAEIAKSISKDKMDIWDWNPGFKHVDFEYGWKTYSIKNATDNELGIKNLQEVFSEKILRDKYNIDRIPVRVNEAIDPNEFSKILKSKGFDSVIVPNSNLFNGYEYLIF